jgi:arylsulfatase A-like enzyme
VALGALVLAVGLGAWLLASRTSTPVAPPSPDPPWLDAITEATRRTRPNILFVVYDARRRDDLSIGPFGNQRNDTPFLAEVAADSLLFGHAVAPGCWTVPVHASIFSGLSTCELGLDYYNPGFSTFEGGFLSLAEILRAAGYHTVAWADHPFFYNGRVETSLVRGFEQFNVVNDFSTFASHTNVADPGGPIELVPQLGPFRHLSVEDFEALVDSFDAGELDHALETGVDHDETTGMDFAALGPLYAGSPYFRRRYEKEFDAHVFTQDETRPWFLFLNLHMCTIAEPDPELFERWYLRTLMLNARRAGRALGHGPAGAPVLKRLVALHQELELPSGPLPAPELFMKQVFDNRFYDATFEGIWRYLETRGRLDNTVTIVTSDHGLSFRENGEPLYRHGGARPYEYIVSVPLMVRFPEGSPHRGLHGPRPERVSLVDLFATMTELGVGPGVFTRARAIRGRSLMDRLATGKFDETIVSECSVAPGSFTLLPDTGCYAKAVYSGGFKLIHAPHVYGAAQWPIYRRLDGAGDQPPAPAPPSGTDQPLTLLYDLAHDPYERHDLAASEPERAERMRQLVTRWECDPSREVGDSPIWNEEALETLRALGYIE